MKEKVKNNKLISEPDQNKSFDILFKYQKHGTFAF